MSTPPFLVILLEEKSGLYGRMPLTFIQKLFNQKLLLEERNDYLFHNKDILQQPHSLLDFYFYKEIKISISLHRLSGQTFENYRESASLLVKSPNLTKGYARYGDSSYTWAAYPCVYPGVWRCLQECMEGSPLSITNNIVKLFDWLPAENSCKIRQRWKLSKVF